MGALWLALSVTPSRAETGMQVEAADAVEPAATVDAAAPPSAAPDPDASGTAPTPAACLARLDAAVLLAENGDAHAAEVRLRALAGRCEHLPQIRHDLGVLAARAGRLPEAIVAFEASLAEDPRAAQTLGHLRDLHRREAALAYARALGTPAVAPMPSLVLQDSSDVNAEGLRSRAGHGELRTLATLEYELYDWWQSAAEGGIDSWLAHYADDYPARLALADRRRDARLRWDEVRREIAFTAEDAVVVLEHGRGARAERRLLLLRLQGNRWKIYQETPL